MGATIFAVATSLQQAGQILRDLRNLQLSPDEVSVLMPEIGIDENRAFGWLQFEDVSFPDLGPFLASGPLLHTLADEGTEDGAVPALIALGLGEDEAQHYEDLLLDHHILIAVHCSDDDCSTQVDELFRRDRAQELASVED